MTAKSGAANHPKHYTLEAYFDMEYKAEQKNEFWNDEVRAKAYASPEHGRIQTNLSDELAACLKAEGCMRYTSYRMILALACNKVFYPDLVIICGEEQFHQHKKKMKATLNPDVLIEILSDSTEQQDYIDECTYYRSIPSLQQYIIVEQNKINLHSYRRKTELEWDYSYADKQEKTVAILDCEVKLEAVYSGIALTGA